MYTYVIPCLLGLEKLVSDECKRLGLQDVKAENGRVLCRGTLEDCARPVSYTHLTLPTIYSV